MTTLQLKSDLHQLIDTISDSKTLKKIHASLTKQLSEDIVGYDQNGKPLTAKALLKRLEHAKAGIAKGNYTTIEDLEKESKTW